MKLDPKPQLSEAGILANLNYFNALEHKYSEQYRDALEQTTYWLRELDKVKSSTDNE